MPDAQTLVLRPPVWALLLAVILGGGFYVYGKSLENVDRNPATITVSGDGRAFAVPDIASLSFGVQVQRQSTAKAAMDGLAKNMKQVVDAVKAAGIPDKDIQTQQLSLQPEYDWQNGTQRLLGYQASQSLQVKVRNLEKTSDILGAATGAGANQVGGVQFTIDEPDTLQAQARSEAIKEAQEHAKKLAAELGMTLGEVRGFSEGGGGGPMPPIMYMRDAAMKVESAQAAPPIPEGEQEVTASVSITYQLR